MQAAGSDWRILPEDRAKHDAKFFDLKPLSGYITGDQAREFFLQSRLPQSVLGHIWTLADFNQDGKMDKLEFSIAMFLIKKKLQGLELPSTLPPSLKLQPPMTMGSFNMSPMHGMGGMQPMAGMQPMNMSSSFGALPSSGMHMSGSMMQPVPTATKSVPIMGSPMGVGMPAGGVPPVVGSPDSRSRSGSLSAEWAIPHPMKLKYKQMFNQNDRQRKGFLTGVQARAILQKSLLSNIALAEIWFLSDIDNDGKLTSEEFCLAMHLVDVAKSGAPLPKTLPPELIPPSYRRGLPPIGNAVGAPPPLSPTIVKQGSIEADNMLMDEKPKIISLEEKKKMNFDRGQQELERRRAMLQEEQKKERDRQEYLEKQEFERKERIRMEQERRRQMELEKQLARQREIEAEQEEQRRKIMEQREAARREMERQRQLELIKNKKQELESMRIREQEEVRHMKGKIKTLQCELGTLEDKKNELTKLSEESQNGVTVHHTSIILMSQSRDVKVSDIDRLQQEIQDIRKRKMLADQEKEQLQSSSKLINKDSGISDTYKTVMHSFKNKKTTMEKLKETLSQVETDTATSLRTIDVSNRSLIDLQANLSKEQSELENLRRKYNIRFDAAKQIESTRKRDGEMAMQTERKRREDEERRKKAEQDMKAKEEQERRRKELEKQQQDARLEAIRKAQEMEKQKQEIENKKQQKTEPSKIVAKSEPFADFGAFGNDPFADTGDPPSKPPNANDPFTSVFGGQSMFNTESKKDPFSAFGASGKLTTDTENKSEAFSNFSDFSSAQFDFKSSAAVKPSKPTPAARKSPVKPTKSISPKIPPSSDEKPSELFSKYKALFPFGGEDPGDLVMKPGDIILVAKDQTAEPGWLGGEISGTSGWFPENYAEKLPSGPASPEPTAPSFTPETSAAPVKTSISEAFPSSNSISNTFEADFGTDSNFKTDTGSTFGTDKFGTDNNFGTDSTEGGWANFGNQPQTTQESIYDTLGAPKPLEASKLVSSSPFKQVVPSETTAPELSTANSNAVYAQAVFVWKAKTDNHLSFEKGDIITVTEQQEMWWYGKVNGQEGWFPKSNVKLIAAPNKIKTSAPEINVDKVETTIAPAEVEYVTLYTFSSEEPGDLNFEANETIYVTSTEGEWWTGRIGNQTGIFPSNYVQKAEGGKQKLALSLPDFTAKGGTLPKKEIARVIAPYQGTGPEQLTLGVGQMIQIRKKNASGWWEGEQQIRGQKKQIGWFPANYVTLLTSGGSGKTTPLQGAASPLTLDVRATTPAANMICQVIAMYPYTSQKDDELTFQKNVVINVMKQDDPDWWEGELNGTTGYFPSNYVQVLNDSTPNNDWCKDIYLLEAMSETEQKRQSRIHELLDTEKSYVDDMVLVVEVFKKPLEDQKRLTVQELGMLFVNWNELIQCNTKLLKAMLVRKTMSGKNQPVEQIGDILCEQLPHLTPYIRFCSCQLSASAMLQKKIDTDPGIKDYLRGIARDKRTKGMPLSSFLIKPMQRITRYPMLIEKILKYTSEDHIDHENIKLALEKAAELCQQVNEGVRERENSDKLEWLQSHVDCTGLPEELVFNSLTNCLGPRKFLHSSMLHKVKSNKELYAFLFNDFLLLTQPVRPGLLFSFSDNKPDMMYKMYRQPLFLSEVSVKVPSEVQDECVFNLTHIEKVYALKTDTEKVRNKWITQIESASKYSIETEKKKREKAQRARSMRSKGIGRLLVVIIEAADLKPSNSVTGHADPYCEVSMGGEENRTRFIPDTLNPKWNCNMQFMVRDLNQDVLCLTVYDKDFLSPDDFLGRTEVRIADIKKENLGKGPVTKRLLLHEVSTGEVVVKFDLILFDQT